MHLESVCYGAVMACGLIATYKISCFFLERRNSPRMSGTNLHGGVGAVEAFTPLPEPLVAPEKTKPLSCTLQFSYPPAVDFWHREIVARDTGEPYRSIIADLLTILCEEAVHVSSVASKFRSTSLSTYSRVGKTSLLDHSLHVAEEFCNQDIGSYITTLGVIAALGHDLGKLPNLQTGYYHSCRHPEQSAQIVRSLLEKYLDRLDGLPALSRKEQCEILAAIERHHQDGEGLLLPRLRKADIAARCKEEVPAVRHDET